MKQEKYEQKGKSAKIVSIVILGIILALLLVIIVLVMTSQNTGSLSEDKMQENAELAEKFQQEGKENVTESEFYTKKLEKFDVNKGSGKNNSGDESAEPDNDYLCSYSSERLITEEDIEKFKKGKYKNLPEGKDIIQMIINEMYAKYGYEFQSEEIQEYFENKEWYKEVNSYNSNMDDIFSEMTEIEKENVKFLSAHKEGE